ncbi:MAG TPA: hypothetical protein VFX49_04280 [Chloroflexota bacterium]|nr:hypothetical protein [Chloroflexota bacterium]
MAGNNPKGQVPPEEAPTPPAGGSAAERIGEVLGTTATRVERLLRDPARRRTVVLTAVGVVVLLAALTVAPGLARRSRPAAPPPAAQPAEPAPAPAEGQPAPAQPAPAQPAPGQPAPAEPGAQPTPAAQPPQRQLLIAALPLLLGLFWLLSAWLVDAEARRAFVVQEPWGERRTVAYTVLAVGCVFPLILAGLIFSAWGFVTFVLDVSRRQSPIAALQAAALILIAGAGFLVLRGLLARWMDQRKATRT